MSKYKIAWMPGDGVGNDVMEDSQENITKAIKAVHEEISKINFV